MCFWSFLQTMKCSESLLVQSNSECKTEEEIPFAVERLARMFS
jgi:hypothetical protein